MRVLEVGKKVALTFDSDRMPLKMLLIRGTVRTDEVEGRCHSATAYRAASPSVPTVVSP